MTLIEVVLTSVILVTATAIFTILWNSIAQSLHFPQLNYIVVLGIVVIFRLFRHLRGYDD